MLPVRRVTAPGPGPVVLGALALASLGCLAVLPAAPARSAAPSALARPAGTASVAVDGASQVSVLTAQARRVAAARAARDAAARTLPRPAPRTTSAAPASAAPAPARPARARVVLPIAGGYRLTAGFAESGGRWYGHRHTGQDFAAPRGTPVRAVAAGVVRVAAFRGSYGRRIEIRHDDGTTTTYSHLSSIAVRPGERVAAGQRIGRVGSTGNTTGPHLHLEVLRGNDEFVNPVRWLRAHGARP